MRWRWIVLCHNVWHSPAGDSPDVAPSTGRFMDRSRQATKFAFVLVTALTAWASAETKKEYRFNVGMKSTVSIINQYGAITVRPSSGNFVVVNATTYSDKVEVDQSQTGN